MATTLTSSSSFSQNGSTGSQASLSDGAVLNFSANTFSSLVKEASSMPEVRNDVVDYYKAQIRSGHYPSQDIVAGLTHLMGGAIAEQLKSSASSTSR